MPLRKTCLPITCASVVLRSKYDLLVIVEDASIVESLRPNFNAIADIETRGVMVSAAGGASGIDFVSRFFSPQCGINEDPVTGSAHCCLAPYWADRLGKTSVVARPPPATTKSASSCKPNQFRNAASKAEAGCFGFASGSWGL